MKREHGQEAIVTAYEVDLRVDLNTEDDTGLPWAPISDARDPSLINEGAWIIVGSGSARAVAQVADIDDGIVHVRPLPGQCDGTYTCSTAQSHEATALRTRQYFPTDPMNPQTFGDRLHRVAHDFGAI